MSKILKRTLTVALICCMLLSVMAPLASAEDPAEPYEVTYNFQKNFSPSSSQKKVLFTEETSPAKGTNWYLLLTTQSTALDSTYGIYNSNSNSYWWNAVMIKVPVSGTYCLSANVTSGNGSWTGAARIYIGKPDAIYSGTTTNLARISDGGASKAISGTYYDVNERIAKETFNQGGNIGMQAYLGVQYMEAGEYIVLLRQQDTKGYASLRSLTLTPSEDATPFVNKISTEGSYTDGVQYFLCNDLVAENAAMYISGGIIFTNGKNITVKSINSNQNMNASATKCGFHDIAGTTVIKTTNGKAPVLPVNKDAVMIKKELPLYNETTGGYDFVTPTTEFALKQDVTNPIIDEAAGTAKFVFKVTLPQEAYALALAGNDPLTITADWTINGEAQTKLGFEGYMEDWTADADGNVFTVTIAGFDKVEENTTVTVTPKVAVGTNVIALETLTYTKTVA